MADRPHYQRGLVPWKPGQSGNPLGRPKGRISLTRLIEERLKDRHFMGKPNPGDQTTAEWLVDAMIVQAVTGNSAYMKEIIDRMEGRIAEAIPPQEIDLESAAAKLDDNDARLDNGKAEEVPE